MIQFVRFALIIYATKS
jgi:patatin-like phospholipase/acyl hydrolase